MSVHVANGTADIVSLIFILDQSLYTFILKALGIKTLLYCRKSGCCENSLGKLKEEGRGGGKK